MGGALGPISMTLLLPGSSVGIYSCTLNYATPAIRSFSRSVLCVDQSVVAPSAVVCASDFVVDIGRIRVISRLPGGADLIIHTFHYVCSHSI